MGARFLPMGIYRGMMGLLLRRPWLLPALLGLAWASRRAGWWHRFPFLPLPPKAYLAWRAETAWGDTETTGPDPLVSGYLRWASRMRREARRRR